MNDVAIKKKAEASTEWCFTDAAHASLNALRGGYLLACPDCAKALRAAIDKGTWSGKGKN